MPDDRILSSRRAPSRRSARWLALAGPLLVATTSAFATTTTLPEPRCADRIEFEDAPAGTRVGTVATASGLGPISIYGTNPRLVPADNAAVLYDSSCTGGCSGGDDDLGTPNVEYGGPGRGAGGAPTGASPNASPLGNVLIVSAAVDDADGDGRVDSPNDQAHETVSLAFDFRELGAVTPQALTLIDVDLSEEPATVETFDADGQTLAKATMAKTGDNGVLRATLPSASPVARMVVTLHGSGAIDNVAFDLLCDDHDPCTIDACERGVGCTHRTAPRCAASTTTSTTTSSLPADTTTSTVVAASSTTTSTMTTSTTVPHTLPACGDADGSGAVTVIDAARILSFSVGLEVECSPLVCDVDGNGVVEALDSLRVLRHAVGLAVALACR